MVENKNVTFFYKQHHFVFYPYEFLVLGSFLYEHRITCKEVACCYFYNNFVNKFLYENA